MSIKDMSSSSDDSDDELIELMALPLIVNLYLNYMKEESSSTEDDTSFGSSVVSAPERKRQKVSKGVGVVGTSSPNAVVATHKKKRETILKGVGVHNSPHNAVVSTQEKKKEFVSKRVGVDDTSSHNAVASAQGKKRQEVLEGVEVKVSQQLDVLLDAMAKKSFKGKDKPGCSIGEVMQIVEGMPEIVDDNELFMKTADILTERQNREMFVALREKNRQIMWLKHKKV